MDMIFFFEKQLLLRKKPNKNEAYCQVHQPIKSKKNDQEEHRLKKQEDNNEKSRNMIKTEPPERHWAHLEV